MSWLVGLSKKQPEFKNIQDTHDYFRNGINTQRQYNGTIIYPGEINGLKIKQVNKGEILYFRRESAIIASGAVAQNSNPQRPKIIELDTGTIEIYNPIPVALQFRGQNPRRLSVVDEGAIKIKIYDALSQKATEDEAQVEINITDTYQNKTQAYAAAINRIPKRKSGTNGGFVTDPKLAKTVLTDCGFMCELDKSHKSFTTRGNRNYMEAHHLLPMAAQADYQNSIDIPDNIVCLCPNCHKMIHYGQECDIKRSISKLYKQKKKLGVINVTLAELFKYYI